VLACDKRRSYHERLGTLSLLVSAIRDMAHLKYGYWAFLKGCPASEKV
jgi:hypothetical protein